MINKKLALTGLFLAASVAFASMPVLGQDGVIFRQRAGNSNFCHLKFPAMQEHTLDWDRPLLKDPSSGDIVDFYGPCDYDPTGKLEVMDQKREQRHRWQRAYAG